MSEAGSDKKDPEDDKRDEERKSRRKPAAPQWVNPDWSGEETGGKTESMTINGVCVVNSGAFSQAEEDKMEED